MGTLVATADGRLAERLAVPPVVVPVGIAGLALLARLTTGSLTIDDAYITFRYARNVARGAGFVYNTGQHVLGTTTPLYTLLLAVLYRVSGVDFAQLALVVGASADAATTVLLFWLAMRIGLGRPWATLLATLFALSPLSITYDTGGMETSLFALLLVGSAAAELAGRPGLAGFCAGLAALTRPEGALMGALVLGRHIAARRLPPLRAVAGFLAPVMPWVLFAFWWFGSPIPQSMVAKVVAYQHLPPFANTIWLLAYLGLPGSSPAQLLLENPPVSGQVGLLVSIVTLLLALPLLPRLLQQLRGVPETWPLAAFAPLLAVAYAASGLKGVPFFQWYLVALAPFYLLGVVLLVRSLTSRLPNPATVLVGGFLLAWALAGLSLGRDAGRGVLSPLGVNLVRENAYAAAARFLAPRLTANTVVALPEIGAFGYAADARILDTVGLVSPEATRFYPLPPGFAGENSIPPDLILQERPAYLVSHDRYLDTPLLEADWFRRNYRLIATFHAQIWDGKDVLVYQRVVDTH